MMSDSDDDKRESRDRESGRRRRTPRENRDYDGTVALRMTMMGKVSQMLSFYPLFI